MTGKELYEKYPGAMGVVVPPSVTYYLVEIYVASIKLTFRSNYLWGRRRPTLLPRQRTLASTQARNLPQGAPPSIPSPTSRS